MSIVFFGSLAAQPRARLSPTIVRRQNRATDNVTTNDFLTSSTKEFPMVRLVTLFVLATLGSGLVASAAAPSYPHMAPVEQYRIANPADEVALARSAAPLSISNDAEILTLGARGYDVAAKGTNGFVCIVERSWADDFSDAEFWNPKLRSPQCLNPAAARSVLPEYLKRTQGVLSGASLAELIQRAKTAIAAKEITAPETGAMVYMMSKQGYLNDGVAGPWHPHVMFLLPPTSDAQWGANAAGSPVLSATDSILPITVFMVPVSKWSDGTPFLKS
jgi:hypothetical protein